jgi:hypothetical protein
MQQEKPVFGLNNSLTKILFSFPRLNLNSKQTSFARLCLIALVEIPITASNSAQLCERLEITMFSIDKITNLNLLGL